MIRQHLHWASAALGGRPMDLLAFGHAGARVLAFPTSRGSYHEWEDRQMPEALGSQIRNGELQLFCVSNVDAESWYDETIPIAERAAWQDRYDAALEHEVLPRMSNLNRDSRLITAGASFGGYHAINFALRHPRLVQRALSMSGLPDVRRLTHGASDGAVYFQNPQEYIALEEDPERLGALRAVDIILAVGRDDSLCAANEAFSRTLWEKGIGNALRIWDGWAHDWPYWQQMVQLYIQGEKS
jgi:esterase/lipase superfamily enzyme